MSLRLDRSTWQCVAFGDVIDSITDRVDNPSEAGVERYVGLEHLDPGSMTVQRWDSPDKVEAQKLRFQPDDVIFGRRRAYQRKVAKADFEGICSAHALVLRARPNDVDPHFLPVFLSSNYFLERAIEISVGSLSPTVNWRDLKVQEFDLPPLDEQKRIADLLWAVERHRRALSDWRAAGMRLYADTRTALLIVGPRGDWMRGKWALDAVDRWASNPPAGWSAETIDSVGRVRSGATPNRSEQARYFDGGDTPWVKTLDLNESVLVATDERITAQAVAETSAKVVPAGTVLVAMYGGFGQIGRTARLGVDAATNQAVSAILELRDDVDPEFLHEVLKAGRPKWRRVAASSRKDPNITKRDVESFDFPLPPREQQSEILAVLATVRRAIDAIADELHAVALLRASLLAEIFGGN